jgi:hypothetical protein
MSRTLRLAALVLACAGITATAAAAQTVGVHPTVKPATGKSRTRFVVTFRAPQSTFLIGMTRVRYLVAASHRTHAKTCVSSASAPVDEAVAGAIVRVELAPRGAGSRWCRGKFRGKIEEFISTICGCPPKAVICPVIACRSSAILALPETIGTFGFRVRK